MVINRIDRYKLIIFLLWLLSIYIIEYDSAYTKLDKSNNIIKVGFYCNKIKYGGIERVSSLLINYLSIETNFSLYLITIQGLLEGE